MTKEEIREKLFSMQDTGYRDFQAKLIPDVDPDSVIGVRTPELRKLAKELVRDEGLAEFLSDLPHAYFDENQLHAFTVSEIRDYGRCAEEVCRFLPYVDNWATCDQMSPKVFAKNRSALLPLIRGWLGSGRAYTVRFGIGMLMEHFLGPEFDPSFPEAVAAVRSDEYYVKMMAAWYFATALAKRYDEILPFIEERRLDAWTHNKAIQKSLESLRIPDDRKEYLRSLKIRQN